MAKTHQLRAFDNVREQERLFRALSVRSLSTSPESSRRPQDKDFPFRERTSCTGWRLSLLALRPERARRLGRDVQLDWRHPTSTAQTRCDRGVRV